LIKAANGTIMGWEETASGYAGVWATENTREALFDAMQRKEVYATTGLRPHQVELAHSLRLRWFELVFRGPEIATPTPAPFGAFDSFSDAYSRVCHVL
jgi:hypothetical protein